MSNILLRQIQAYGEIIISGDVEFQSSTAISNTANPSELGTSAVNFTGDVLTLGRLFYASGLTKNPPSLNTRSSGTRIVLEPGISNSTTDYSIGLESSNMWFQSNGGFKFYNKATEVLAMSNESASLTISGGTTLTLGDALVVRNTSSSGASSVLFKNSNGDNRFTIGFGNSSYTSFANTSFLLGYSDIAINAGNVTNANHFYIKSTGEVGINTSTPSYKLDVNGTLGVTSTASFLSTTDATSSTQSGAVQVSGGLSVAKSIWVSSGVNITGPNNTTTLSIKGDTSANNVLRIQNSASSSAAKLHIINSGASSGSALSIYQTDEQYVSLESSGNDKFTLKTINNAGSGTTKALVLEASSNNTGSTNQNQLVLETNGNVSVANNLLVTGSITSGTWAASTISVARGGTGQTSFSQGQLLFGDGTNALSTSSGLTWSTGSNTLSATNLSVSGEANIPLIYSPSIQAHWTISGGGNVTWNGSYLKWSARVVLMPIEKTEMGATGLIEIGCPTSGTITYYNASNVTTTATCTADGIPLASNEALYYQITVGQNEASQQTNFRLVNYQNSTWRPTSNWILLAVNNGESGSAHLKWVAGQFNFPTTGGVYNSSSGIGDWQLTSSGSADYMPLYTSQNVLTNSIVQQKSSKIGIGLNPSAQAQKLQVQGEVLLNIMNTVDTSGKITLGRQDLTAREHNIEAYNSATAASNYIRFNVHNGSLSNTINALTLYGDNSGAMNKLTLTDGLYITNTNAFLTNVSSDANNLAVRNSSSSTATRFSIINNGSASDSGLLIYQSGETTANGSFLGIQYTSSADFLIRTSNSTGSGSARALRLEAASNTSGASNSNQVYLATDGNVGIGYSTPTAKLEVDGSVRVRSTTDSTTNSTTGALMVSGGLAVAKSVYVNDTVSANQITNRGFTLVLGNADQVSRGDSGSSRALVKDSGNVLVINLASDYTGGTKVDSNLSVNGDLTVNSVNITPSTGDISKEQSFSASNNQSSAANVTGFAFPQSNVRSFFAYVSVTINASANLYAQYELRGLQKGVGTWILSSQYIGDNTGIVFSITSSAGNGQIQYTSTNIAGFVSNNMKFRGYVTST